MQASRSLTVIEARSAHIPKSAMLPMRSDPTAMSWSETHKSKGDYLRPGFKIVFSCLAFWACASVSMAKNLNCVMSAAQHHGVNHWVLSGILWQESRWKADAVRSNTNGTVDHGIAQINSVHLPELRTHRIEAEDLMDACVGTYVAAWHLRKQIDKYGNNWFAVGAYHSRTPELNRKYAQGVCQVVRHWQELSGRGIHPIACENMRMTSGVNRRPGQSHTARTETGVRDGPSTSAER